MKDFYFAYSIIAEMLTVPRHLGYLSEQFYKILYNNFSSASGSSSSLLSILQNYASIVLYNISNVKLSLDIISNTLQFSQSSTSEAIVVGINQSSILINEGRLVLALDSLKRLMDQINHLASSSAPTNKNQESQKHQLLKSCIIRNMIYIFMKQSDFKSLNSLLCS